MHGPSRYLKIVLTAIIVLSFSIPVQGQRHVEDDGSILLPSQRHVGKSTDDARQARMTSSAAWSRFLEDHGGWWVRWDEATGTPHRAFGEAVPIAGYSSITPDNVGAASLSFIRQHATLLGVRPAELRLVRSTLVNNRWYVSYIQTLQDIDVLLSEVDLRIFPNGNVVAFGAQFYTDITVSPDPSLSYEMALERATAGLDLTDARPEVFGEGRLFILPVRTGTDVTYHLVYEVFVHANAPPGSPMDGVYVSYVDAHSGEVIWRINQVHSADVRGRVRGDVQLVLPTDPFVERDIVHQFVNIGTSTVTTSTSGTFQFTITSPTPLTAMLRGPWVDVNRSDGPDAIINLTVNPTDSVNLLWNDGNSHPAERDAFFHTVIVHNYLTALDTAFTAMNYIVPCAVNWNLTCNAQWRGNEGMRFYREGDGCLNTAQMPSVVYHEYGHGVNQRLYERLRGFGMVNGAANEGTADVLSSMIEDHNLIGRGFRGVGTFIRNVQNTNRYPENVTGQVHNDGLIIGGTFWDLRQATSLATARYLSHFAKYGTPDDPDLGTAYSEWFVETLVADDDDGNLGNGTPHFTAIINAFNAHGIGSTLFFRRSFFHTPIASTYDTLNAFTVTFGLEGTPIPGGAPQDVQVVYSLDNFQTSVTLPAAVIGQGLYQAAIPSQPAGTLVRYYMSARDPLANVTFTFPSGAPSAASYGFLVGAHRAQTGVMYAVATGNPHGRMYTIDPATAQPTLVGSLGVNELHSLTIHPRTKEMYGTTTSISGTTLYRVSPTYGAAFAIRSLPLANARALAFGPADLLYAATLTGTLVRVSLATGDTTSIGTASGVTYADLCFNPTTGVLWASVRPPIAFRDRIYTVNRFTGEATLVGATGDGFVTPSIAFNSSGLLYGLKGTSSQINTIISIDTVTGAGTTIGSTGLQNIQAIAIAVDSIVTSVQELQDRTLPAAFRLGQNYPNPFNPGTSVEIQVPSSEIVTVRVFDMLGREVATLLQERLEPGTYRIRFDGGGMSSGVYLYRMQAGGFRSTKKMMLLK